MKTEKSIFEPYINDSTLIWNNFFEVMTTLGFEVDSYKGYDIVYGSEEQKDVSSIEAMDVILDNLKKCDKDIVGNFILTKWSSIIEHWIDYKYDDIDEHYFLPLALSILEDKLRTC